MQQITVLTKLSIAQKVYTDTILLSTSQQLITEKEADHQKGQIVSKIKELNKLPNNQLTPINKQTLVTNTTINIWAFLKSG